MAATSLCPCSKEISNYGVHNQRSHIQIHAELSADMTIALAADARVAGFEVEVENFESIHNHSAFARMVSAGPVPGRPDAASR